MKNKNINNNNKQGGTRSSRDNYDMQDSIAALNEIETKIMDKVIEEENNLQCLLEELDNIHGARSSQRIKDKYQNKKNATKNLLLERIKNNNKIKIKLQHRGIKTPMITKKARGIKQKSHKSKTQKHRRRPNNDNDLADMFNNL